MIPPIVADTGGLLRALACTADGKPTFPDYENVLTSASVVVVPALVLAEVDYFLRENRPAMRKLVAEVFDPGTRYEYELPLPSDVVRALELAERRHVYRVLTTDRRDFGAIRVGRRLARALEVLP